jgi:acylphosphatase
MGKKAVRLIIKGLVQGVGFRASLREVALHYGVSGWVRNRNDGSVEALLEGDEEKIDAVILWARRGPPRARVTSVEKFDVQYIGLKEFRIR